MKINPGVMKYKLLGVSTEDGVNIGDYIQALAAGQYYDNVDGFVQREKLSEYSGEPSAIIMNGWFMHHPFNWPPPQDLIKPLFVAFHINVSSEKELLSKKSIEYLKNHSPIGCRDQRTCRLLRDKGVDAYFSGCLTLTLGNIYHTEEKSGRVFFVDVPDVLDLSFGMRLKSALNIFFKKNLVKSIAKNYYKTEKLTLRQLKHAGAILATYNKLFDAEILEKAEFVNHFEESEETDDWKLLAKAESLVKKYAAASLVVTTRIHCALPCLGLGTPVIYIDDPKAWDISTCRMDGLLQLFNVLQIGHKRLVPYNGFPKGKISLSTIPQNGDAWKPLAEGLRKRCAEFVGRMKDLDRMCGV